MYHTQLHYLPLTPPSFSLLVGIFIVVVVLIQLGVLRYAYLRLGLSPLAAMLLLVGSLVGSYFNIPVYDLPAQQVVSGREIIFFGMRYVVPVVTQWPNTIIAVNVGGAVIPTVMSAYLILRYRLLMQGRSRPQPSHSCATSWPTRSPALESRNRCSCRRLRPPSSPFCSRASMRRRSLISGAASGRCSEPTCSISARSRGSAPRSHRSAAPELLTASS